MDPPPISVAEFHRVDEAPDLFIRFLNSQEKWGSVATELFDLITGRPGNDVLDVGCGLGSDTASLASRLTPSGTIVGVDAAEAMVHEAALRHPGLSFRVARAEHLPFGDEAFDAVVSARMLQHLPEPGAALKEMLRVLRPSGRLAVMDVDHGSTVFDCATSDVLDGVLAATSRQLSPNVGRQLLRLVRASGFVDASVQVVARTVLATTVLPLRVLDHLAAEAVAAGAVTPTAAKRLRDEWVTLDSGEGGFAVILRFFASGVKPSM